MSLTSRHIYILTCLFNLLVVVITVNLLSPYGKDDENNLDVRGVNSFMSSTLRLIDILTCRYELSSPF